MAITILCECAPVWAACVPCVFLEQYCALLAVSTRFSCPSRTTLLCPFCPVISSVHRPLLDAAQPLPIHSFDVQLLSCSTNTHTAQRLQGRAAHIAS